MKITELTWKEVAEELYQYKKQVKILEKQVETLKEIIKRIVFDKTTPLHKEVKK